MANADLAQLEKESAKPLATPGPSVPALAALLDETAGLITRYIALPGEGVQMLVALWIAMTYTFRKFSFCGYLALRSATPRCGKSRLLRLMAQLANGNPPVTGTPSAALLIRRTRDVFILDEVDKLRNADKDAYGEVIAVLNIAFDSGGCFEKLEKTSGGGWAPKRFPVYGPVALAGIERLADTLGDRAFQLQMKRSPTRLPRLNSRRFADIAATLREGFASWAEHHTAAIESVYLALPDELTDLTGFDDRFQDIAEPLVVLATLADAEQSNGATPILPRLLTGLRAAAGQREPSGRERELSAFLALIDDRLPSGADELFLSSSELLEAFREHPDLSRIETGRALAGLLKHFELTPGTNTTKTIRGYWIRRAWLDEWTARYA